MNRQVTYFTDEGGFGDAKGLIRIDTTNWTAQDWLRIIQAEELTRKITAMQIEQIHKEKTEVLKECTHDWYWIGSAEEEMKCQHCHERQR